MACSSVAAGGNRRNSPAFTLNPDVDLFQQAAQRSKNKEAHFSIVSYVFDLLTPAANSTGVPCGVCR